MDITNNKKPEKKVDSKNYKLYTIRYYPSFLEKLKHSLKRFNICLIAKPPQKLKNIIFSKIDPINFENYSGVYETPFIKEGRCQNYYIGMTSRIFSYRKKEPIADIK